MTQVKVKTRPTGATAALARMGQPTLVTPTGGRLDVTTSASDAGFNPIDLLYSSLAACMVLSARIAASKLGILDRFENVTAEVSGEKAKTEPSRIEIFHIALDIKGDFNDEERQAIGHMAEDICTVSNTLRGSVEFTLTVKA
ncbi:OsmC family protein [Agrobacterium sp.]|uniref:OsmC family protein n=1 Tax=Agrobacterium sp. TaxID=361 RepID=UPI0028A5B330|nr:OsmC family protein [Agrobacterium sp.]